MSKLIVCTGTLSAGGAERVLSILSKPFADAFDEVQYVMWLDAKYPEIFYEIDSRVRIVRMSQASGSTKIWRQMLWFRRYVKLENPDVVLSFMIVVCLTVTSALLFSGVRQVVAIRNDLRFMKRKRLRSMAMLVFCSTDVKGILTQSNVIRDYFSVKKRLYKKTHIIFNPIQLDNHKIGAALKTKKENLVVSVGRLCGQKQQHVLIDAFARFHATHPDYQLVLYGEGNLRDRLEQQAHELGIADSVTLAGRSKTVIDKILMARMFVLTSVYEGMSNALLEAMCIGLPCISTKVSGATDLIKNGHNGFLVDVGDVERIAERMSALADDEVLCERIGINAQAIYPKLSSLHISTLWTDYLKSVM